MGKLMRHDKKTAKEFLIEGGKKEGGAQRQKKTLSKKDLYLVNQMEMT